MTGEVVLDTHVVLWWLAAPERVSAAADVAIQEATSITISAISMWEVAMLVNKGRIELDRPVVAWMRALSGVPRVRVLPLSGESACRAADLADLHGDPADRMIVATALEVRGDLVTKDARLLDWAGPRSDINAIW
ncbi:MAG TPA: type II toxin-antitoxin system VapC family toxin [Ilumatobacter sp.]|nr:type II toxin-antitoxin system VapC family toxin [Ilumatobacter sp.]